MASILYRSKNPDPTLAPERVKLKVGVTADPMVVVTRLSVWHRMVVESVTRGRRVDNVVNVCFACRGTSVSGPLPFDFALFCFLLFEGMTVELSEFVLDTRIQTGTVHQVWPRGRRSPCSL